MTVPGLPDTIFAQPNPLWVSGYDTYKLTGVSSQGREQVTQFIHNKKFSLKEDLACVSESAWMTHNH